MSELCVLAAVSFAAAQSDQADQRVNHARAEHPSVEQTEHHSSNRHCSSSEPRFSSHSPTIEHPISLQWPEALPEFSSSRLEVASTSTITENESFTEDDFSQERSLHPVASNTASTVHAIEPLRTDQPPVPPQFDDLASIGDRHQAEPSARVDPETALAIRRDLRPPVFSPLPLPQPTLASPTPSQYGGHERPAVQQLAQVSVPTMKALRPSSGRQFYRQRRVALQSGQSYTRISSDQFSATWLDSTYEPSHEDWVGLLAREARAMAAGQGSNRLTIMVGDSLSLWFPPEYMSRHRFWLNQAISGDTATGTLRRLNVFAQTNPDVIHVMIGINDLRGGASNRQVLEAQRRIIRHLRHQHPDAQVIVHSLLPTRMASLPSDRIRHINERLGAIAAQEGAQLLDLHRYFIDESGQMNPAFTTDGLHLNAAGYALWYQVLSQLRLA